MYVKLIGSILVVASTTALGMLFGEQFRVRARRLLVLKQIFLMLSGEIRCHRGTLAESFRRIAVRAEEPFSSWLTAMAGDMDEPEGKQFRRLWEEHTDRSLSGCGLKEKDLLYIKELGGQIGYLDARMQETVLNQAALHMEGELTLIHDGLSEKIKLCRVLGAAGGLLLVVLLL